MNIRNILFRTFAATALFWAVACEKPDQPGTSNTDPDGSGVVTPSDSEINGTTIIEGNNLIGLVSDSNSGKGIAGVAVSDGYSVVKTDINGVYQFKGSRYATAVFISLPAGYQVPLDNAKKPAFYKVGIVRNSVNRNDFTLTPLTESEDNFTLLAIGDPQCSNATEAGRYKTETINDIKLTLASNQASGRFSNAYAVTLGDIVNDTPELWNTMRGTMENIEISNNRYLPVFQCIGNHDHDAKTSSDEAAVTNFLNNYGPTDYSFNRGKVHIVVMDNVVCKTTNNKTWDYDAGFSKSQYNWLRADLDAVEDRENKMVILCCHIPFRAGSTSGGSNVNKDKYYAETLELLKEFNEAHIMIGHTHYPQNYIHEKYVAKGGLPIYEHVHGGACGGWWSSNMNVDGAPNGYSIYEIEGNHMKNWLCKSTGFAEDFQMKVYNGNQTWSGTKGYTYNWYQNSTGGSANIAYTGRSYLKNCFVVSLWNDDEKNWKVEFTHNGKTVPMTRTIQSVMDAAAVSYFFNECGKNTTSWNKALMHYWYVSAPEGVDPSEMTGWTITATQTIPGSGVKNIYTSGSLQIDYTGF